MDKQELFNFYYNNKKVIKIFSIFFLFLFFIIFSTIVLVYIFGPKNNKTAGDDNFTHLPGDLARDDSGLNSDKLNGIRAEDIMFGHFYKKRESHFSPSFNSYKLPIDVKTEVENYYDVSRKIDLNDYVEDLNQNGFKIISNPFIGADDFFALYNELLEKEIPVIITNDFLMYLYQNNLKNVFDEIERNTFYKNIWDIYRNLFDIASARYEERLSRLGVSNDPVLEGQRLETAYLAIVLKLLTPTKDQTSEYKSLNNHNNFSKSEAIYYDFKLPDYLQKDVNKELQRIRDFRGVERSSVFLYPVDYSKFAIPTQYKKDAKLYNFYLATKWLNSEFPLYFKSSSCPDCLLDKDDWLINMTSASFLAKDLSDNQSDKNKWAIIYKFISYFSGLRQDLTYLEYNRALEDIYGQGYVVENIFNKKNFSDIDIYKIQSKIAANKFSEIEGSYNRQEEKNPLIGMRMLQDPFWPNDYIFKQLTGEDMRTIASKEDRRKQITLCGNYRCRGTALDVFNLRYPMVKNDKFVRESQYTGYDTKVQKLRDYMAGFNVFTWNTNVYWSTLDILNSYLSEDKTPYPVFTKSDEWFNQKELNTVLGSWVNIHVPKDIISITSSSRGDFASLRPICDLPNYVEPNLDYLYENISRNNMLLDMMDVLNVSRDTNLAALDIEEINSQFERIIEINKKTLSGTLPNYSDCMYIRSLVNNKKINKTTKSGKKSVVIHLDKASMSESLNGVKLLIVVFGHGDDKVIAMGPIYDYKESAR